MQQSCNLVSIRSNQENGFTLSSSPLSAASDNGIVMTCGDGSFGALGHGDWQSSSTPKVKNGLTIPVTRFFN